MSLSSAMFTGVSGLQSNAQAISVIGNNIANSNTVGYKSSSTLFADLLSQNIGNNSQVGTGERVQTIRNNFSEGSLTNSTNVTDLAIQGNSFFAVKTPNITAPVNQNAALLTRAGSFGLDSSLTLVNPDGYQVLDTAGNPIKFSDNAAAITAANTALAAASTPAAFTTAATTIQTEAAKYVLAGANSAATLVTAVTALPGVTAADTTAVTAISTAATAAKAAADAAVATPNAANNAAAQAAFNTLNTLTNNTTLTTAGAPALLTTFKTALNISNTAVNTANSTYTTAQTNLATANGLAFSKITSIDPSGLITYLGQDGTTLNYYNTSGAVGVAATTANAATVQRLAVVSVANPAGLSKMGGNLYQSTTASGVPAAAFSLATNSANGTSEAMLSNYLESSNVDMATELVNMLTTQRAYSANSKTITTADQMTQETLALIR